MPTNIAEGASRQHKKDYLQFLYVARSSLSELEYLLTLASRFGYFREGIYEDLIALSNETDATLLGLIRSVESDL